MLYMGAFGGSINYFLPAAHLAAWGQPKSRLLLRKQQIGSADAIYGRKQCFPRIPPSSLRGDEGFKRLSSACCTLSSMGTTAAAGSTATFAGGSHHAAAAAAGFAVDTQGKQYGHSNNGQNDHICKIHLF